MSAFIRFLLLLSILAWSVPAHSFEASVVLTEEIQLKIADAFMDEGEYYRAVTEYKKLLILFPISPRSDYVLFKTGTAYYRGEEYEASAHSFSSLREKYPGSPHAAEAGYFEGLSYWQMKRYESARIAFASILLSHPGSEQAPLALIASSLVLLDTDNISGSMRELRKLMEDYPEHPSSISAREAMKLLGEYRNLPAKSEVLAGAMSAIIPGSGYMYAGHFKDGITAFLINGLSIAGTVTGVNQENYAVGAIAGGIGLPFYLGNIYGSANAAKKSNIAARNELRGNIRSVLGF